jgi:hypothetical protein
MAEQPVLLPARLLIFALSFPPPPPSRDAPQVVMGAVKSSQPTSPAHNRFSGLPMA